MVAVGVRLPLAVLALKPVPVHAYDAAAGEQATLSKVALPCVTGLGAAVRVQEGVGDGVELNSEMRPMPYPDEPSIPYQRLPSGPRMIEEAPRPEGTA